MTRSPWHGKLNLIYAHQEGATQIIHGLNEAPLKVQRPFYPEGQEICHTVALHTAGGIVGGDQLSYNIQLKPQSQALITTAAASKIYRSNGSEAQSTITMDLDVGSSVEWLPQESIVFSGAEYRQTMLVNLAPQANFCGWEITRFGRTARGEQFLQGNWRSRTEIWQQGKPLWIDRQWLPGGLETVESPHALGGCPIVGSFLWIGIPVPPDCIATLRELSPSPAASAKGVTQTQGQGVLCRYRGSSTREVRDWFTTVWHYLREKMRDRAPIYPRVWQ